MGPFSVFSGRFYGIFGSFLYLFGIFWCFEVISGHFVKFSGMIWTYLGDVRWTFDIYGQFQPIFGHFWVIFRWISGHFRVMWGEFWHILVFWGDLWPFCQVYRYNLVILGDFRWFWTFLGNFHQYLGIFRFFPDDFWIIFRLCEVIFGIFWFFELIFGHFQVYLGDFRLPLWSNRWF